MNEYLAELQGRPRSRWGGGYRDYERNSVRPTRRELTDRYAYAIPDQAAIDRLVRLGPIVEVGAGRGYWAYLIARAGGDVVAYDLRPRGDGRYFQKGRDPWYPVHYGGAEAAADWPDRALLLCWPPYGTEMAERALRAYRGDTLAYVGEGNGGCTGGEGFHDLLDVEWEEVEVVDIPTFEGIHDALFIYRRRKP